MTDIQYIGENLFVGQIGHFLVILSFVVSLFSAFSYFKFNKSQDSSWLKMGRVGYIIHGLAVFSIIGLLLYAMSHKLYEYSYVQRQVSDDLPWYYLFSALWQGQEGSFLLWMFWHTILGFVLIKTAHRWESGVMSVLALVQGFLMSMILGLYIPFTTDERIGSSPFSLLRNTMDAPIFSNADYLSLVTGTGLNPLLQNYWMTIHPPVLFLGFASVTIPFCYAVAALYEKSHLDWLVPAFRWALFSSFILGLGILMGGAWAYEALSFGGYWAWDPVENSSLVPWLVGVAALHTHLIARHTGRAIGTTYSYYILAFLLILYSTFLTRSGVLGDTSVHAFTEMGLESQLMAFMAFFAAVGLFFYFKNRKSIPKVEGEEMMYSREFWMYIGSMVLLFSGILLTISTSLPVYNKIVQVFNPDYIGQVINDQMAHHNKYQLWIAVFMGLLSSFSLMLRYREFNWADQQKKFAIHSGAGAVIALLLTFIIQKYLVNSSWQHGVLLFSALFTVITNVDYVFLYSKNNAKATASFVSHIGFGVLILGVLFTGLNKRHISTNPFAQRGITAEENLEETVTLIKGRPFFMTNYWVNYKSDTMVGNLKKFEISFKEIDTENTVIDSFTVQPSAIYSNDFRSIAAWNPSTKRYLSKDIFTQIAGYPSHLQNMDEAQTMEGNLKYNRYNLFFGQDLVLPNYTIKLTGVDFEPELERRDSSEYDMGVGLNLTITPTAEKGESHSIQLALALQNGLVYQLPKVIDDLGIKLRLQDSLFIRLFKDESTLTYEKIDMKDGESKSWKGYNIRLKGFNKNPKHRNYKPKEGDIAISALLEIEKNGINREIAPLFIIRNSQQFSIKEYVPEWGLHLRYSKINPTNGMMTFEVTEDPEKIEKYPIEIAENVPRSDILAFEAKVFPGINLVWAGSLMMLSGFMISLLRRPMKKLV